jgi:hypothetical protein
MITGQKWKIYCNYYYDDGISKSPSKESSYLDKNKENNSYNDNSRVEWKLFKTPKEAKKKRWDFKNIWIQCWFKIYYWGKWIGQAIVLAV